MIDLIDQELSQISLWVCNTSELFLGGGGTDSTFTPTTSMCLEYWAHPLGSCHFLFFSGRTVFPSMHCSMSDSCKLRCCATVYCAVCTVVFVAPVMCCSVNCTSAWLLNFSIEFIDFFTQEWNSEDCVGCSFSYDYKALP